MCAQKLWDTVAPLAPEIVTLLQVIAAAAGADCASPRERFVSDHALGAIVLSMRDAADEQRDRGGAADPGQGRHAGDGGAGEGAHGGALGGSGVQGHGRHRRGEGDGGCAEHVPRAG